MSSLPICATCGVQYDVKPEGDCRICADSRQWVPHDGQKWTTLDELRARHGNVFTDVEPGVVSIHTEPSIAIGQRAFLIDTGAPSTFFCKATIDAINLDSADAIEVMGHGVAFARSTARFAEINLLGTEVMYHGRLVIDYQS